MVKFRQIASDPRLRKFAVAALIHKYPLLAPVAPALSMKRGGKVYKRFCMGGVCKKSCKRRRK